MNFPSPGAGDIVECRFPEKEVPGPGPKERPALVLHAERFPDRSSHVVVAYGTSQDVDHCHPGEFTLRASEPGAGLTRDTKFDLRRAVKLPFDDTWFRVAPGKPFGEHPKRGRLNLEKPAIKRKFQAAVIEARAAGAFEVLDLTPTDRVAQDDKKPDPFTDADGPKRVV